MCEGSHPEVIVISPSSSLPITHLLLTDEAGKAPLLTLSTYHRRFDFVSNCLGTKWILASPSKLFCDELKVKYKLLTVSCKLSTTTYGLLFRQCIVWGYFGISQFATRCSKLRLYPKVVMVPFAGSQDYAKGPPVNK